LKAIDPFSERASIEVPMTDLTLNLRPEQPGDREAIDRLHERAFGPGRFARTAFRLREGAGHDFSLSFTATVGTLLVGSVRLSPIWAGTVPALVLGPLTVEPAFKERGIGAALMNRSLQAAREAGHGLVLLVGDFAYYERFGFKPIPPGRLRLPGPVDPGRFLACELEEGGLERAQGAVAARRS
jgi:predicted N-acetyltransferase YhbS